MKNLLMLILFSVSFFASAQQQDSVHHVSAIIKTELTRIPFGEVNLSFENFLQPNLSVELLSGYRVFQYPLRNINGTLAFGGSLGLNIKYFLKVDPREEIFYVAVRGRLNYLKVFNNRRNNDCASPFIFCIGEQKEWSEEEFNLEQYKMKFNFLFGKQNVKEKIILDYYFGLGITNRIEREYLIYSYESYDSGFGPKSTETHYSPHKQSVHNIVYPNLFFGMKIGYAFRKKG